MYKTLQEIDKYDFNYHKLCDDLQLRKTETPRFIIALTSFPGRIVNTYKTILSLLMQGDDFRVVLTLCRRQFPSMAFVPKSLQVLSERANLDIIFCEDDWKVFKKSIFARKLYPTLPCITVDDDLYYMNGFVDIMLSVYNACEGKRILTWFKNDFVVGDKVFHGNMGAASMFPPSESYNELYLKHLHKDMIDICLDDEYNGMIADIIGIPYYTMFHRNGIQPGESHNFIKSIHSSGYYMHDLQQDRYRMYELFKSTFIEEGK